VSSRALEKAKTVKNRGYYFDFVDMLKYHEERADARHAGDPQIHAWTPNSTTCSPRTPAARYDRPRAMAKIVRAWAQKHFAVFSEDGYGSPR
jgi:aspartate aminotransferase-like enzyme